MLKALICSWVTLVCSWAIYAIPPKSSPIGLAEAPPPRQKKTDVPPPALITAELNRTSAQPGDLMRLVELVPVDRKFQVQSVTHTVHIIGQYDFDSGCLINRDPEKALHSNGKIIFDQWKGETTMLGDRYFQFSVINPRQEGLEFEFNARQIGIYLIKANWTLYRSRNAIESNPVILTVRPPISQDGKPIIRKEWIDSIYWERLSQ